MMAETFAESLRQCLPIGYEVDVPDAKIPESVVITTPYVYGKGKRVQVHAQYWQWDVVDVHDAKMVLRNVDWLRIGDDAIRRILDKYDARFTGGWLSSRSTPGQSGIGVARRVDALARAIHELMTAWHELLLTACVRAIR